jgi:hypothetical protein
MTNDADPERSLRELADGEPQHPRRAAAAVLRGPFVLGASRRQSPVARPSRQDAAVAPVAHLTDVAALGEQFSSLITGHARGFSLYALAFFVVLLFVGLMCTIMKRPSIMYFVFSHCFIMHSFCIISPSTLVSTSDSHDASAPVSKV